MKNKILGRKKNNSRGQIGETMTWVVATIVIIVILGISIFIVKFNVGNTKTFAPSISNDLIVTKSAVSFLSYENNSNDLKNSINSEDYTLVKPGIEKFLDGITINNEWDFRILVDGEIEDNSVLINNLYGLAKNKWSFFVFDLNGKKIEIKINGGRG